MTKKVSRFRIVSSVNILGCCAVICLVWFQFSYVHFDCNFYSSTGAIAVIFNNSAMQTKPFSHYSWHIYFICYKLILFPLDLYMWVRLEMALVLRTFADKIDHWFTPIKQAYPPGFLNHGLLITRNPLAWLSWPMVILSWRLIGFWVDIKLIHCHICFF